MSIIGRARKPEASQLVRIGYTDLPSANEALEDSTSGAALLSSTLALDTLIYAGPNSRHTSSIYSVQLDWLWKHRIPGHHRLFVYSTYFLCTISYHVLLMDA